MKTMVFFSHKWVSVIGILLLASLLTTSCKVTFVPEYDAELSAQIDETAKMVDRFYLEMLETTSNQNRGRAFERFIQGYIDVEVELNSLLNKNKIKPLNDHSTRICEITLQLWAKYKDEHKTDDGLSDGLIKLNRQTFSDLFYAMQVAEKGKEIVSEPPK